nr:nuclear transport factor 2 family protein [Sphingomonas sp. CDS-1]
MIALNDEELLAAMQPENRAIFMPLEKRSGPRMTPLEMIELNGEHSRRFFAGDFDGIMEHSLIDDPVYEFLPARIRVRGKEAVHRYHELNYEIVIAQVDPERRETPADAGATLTRSFGENSFTTEISTMLKLGTGEPQRCYFNAVITFQDGKMVGERVWMDQKMNDFFVAGLEKDPEFFKLPGVERF